MRLLVDSDAFCKLAVSDLLSDAAMLFDVELPDCGRLPALPYMLRRGGLPRTYGARVCDRLIPVAESMPAIRQVSSSWLEQLALIPAIDPGEAILFAAAADLQLPVLSGDVRALRALKRLDGFPEVLAGRIVPLEAVLLALCRELGTAVVRERIEPVQHIDTVMRICFSPGVQNPEQGLDSYLTDRRRELAPLVLWGTHEENE